MVKQNFPKSIACYEDLIASTMIPFGLRTVDSKIYAFVFCSLEPVSLEEISKGTGYSLATASNVAKLLTGFNLLKKIKKPGTKKVFVEAQRDTGEMIVKKMYAALEYMVKPKKGSLPKLISDLKSDLKNETSAEKKKIGKKYLELLKDDLKRSNLLEDIYLHLIDYVEKKVEK